MLRIQGEQVLESGSCIREKHRDAAEQQNGRGVPRPMLVVRRIDARHAIQHALYRAQPRERPVVNLEDVDPERLREREQGEGVEPDLQPSADGHVKTFPAEATCRASTEESRWR